MLLGRVCGRIACRLYQEHGIDAKGSDMAAGQCDICSKKTVFGRNIRFQHGGRWERKAPRTSRTFKPNVHKQWVFLNGERQRVNICTRCLRTTSKTVA